MPPYDYYSCSILRLLSWQYDHAFFFTLAASVTTVPIMYYLMKNPFDGTGPIAVTDLFTGEHGYSAFWASCGGFAWTLGTVVNLVSSSQVSEAVAYSIGQSAPMVAAGWGIFVFGKPKPKPELKLSLNLKP